MRHFRLFAAGLLTAATTIPFRADAGTLRGSPSSMEQQHEVAVDEDLSFAEEASQIESLVDSGQLVPVKGNRDYALSGVSFPYARPEVLLFIERLAAQYHADIGSRLVVTSLTRPESLQPKNAHRLSVHPAGMAVDFRIPSKQGQAWLEKALLGLENSGVLDVTREKHPPHYHVAVFPAEYKAYALKRMAQEPAPATEPDLMQIEVIPEPRAAAVVKAAQSSGHTPLLIAVIGGSLLVAAGGVGFTRRRALKLSASGSDRDAQ
ncbi:MAG TPA: DUF5715 family protein [Gemmatimonadaceae bacterium]